MNRAGDGVLDKVRVAVADSVSSDDRGAVQVAVWGALAGSNRGKVWDTTWSVWWSVYLVTWRGVGNNVGLRDFNDPR